jgi:hypothetical protein
VTTASEARRQASARPSTWSSGCQIRPMRRGCCHALCCHRPGCGAMQRRKSAEAWPGRTPVAVVPGLASGPRSVA